MAKKLTLRQRATLVGVLILLAYGVLVSATTDQPLIVLLADLVSGLSVIGIALLLYPLFKPVGKGITLSYLYLKIAEGGLMIVGALAYALDTLRPFREWVYDTLHLYVFIAGAFIFYYLLYKTKLVPRFIAVWGSVAILSLFVNTVTKILGLYIPALDYLLILIITNEIFLALWLIIKGFKAKVVQ